MADAAGYGRYGPLYYVYEALDRWVVWKEWHADDMERQEAMLDGGELPVGVNWPRTWEAATELRLAVANAVLAAGVAKEGRHSPLPKAVVELAEDCARLLVVALPEKGVTEKDSGKMEEMCRLVKEKEERWAKLEAELERHRGNSVQPAPGAGGTARARDKVDPYLSLDEIYAPESVWCVPGNRIKVAELFPGMLMGAVLKDIERGGRLWQVARKVLLDRQRRKAVAKRLAVTKDYLKGRENAIGRPGSTDLLAREVVEARAHKRTVRTVGM